MAKSSSTTKAKTKTTKKPAARSAAAKTTKASTKAKTTKSSAKAKTTKKPAVAKTVTKAPVVKTAAGFNRGFVLAGAALAILAGLAGFFMKSESAQVFLGHLTKNELASRAGTVLVSAAHPLYELEIRWVLVALLGVAALFAVLRGTRWQARENAGVAAGVNSLRWIDFAVTGALAFELVALVNGLQDVVALKLGMLSIALVAYFAWMYERENAATGKPARASLIGSQLAAVFASVALLSTVLGTYVYGMVRSPWYAYAALVVFILWLVGVVSRLKRTTTSKQNYAAISSAYDVQSLIVKVLLAAILIVGLYAN